MLTNQSFSVSEQQKSSDPPVFTRPRVAVLPFKNRSDDADLDFFCEGVGVEILIGLARTPGLGVVTRSAVFALDSENLSPVDMGKRLNATDVLEGSLSIQDDQFHVWVSLIDVATGKEIWGTRSKHDLKDIVAVQDEITERVVNELKLGTLPEDLRNMQSMHTDNLEAYECYLRGRHMYYQFNQHSVEAACGMFEKGVELDPEYALAYSGLADCYCYLHMYVDRAKGHLEKAYEASAKALELDNSLAEAYASSALVLSQSGEFDRAEAALSRAIELDPQLFEARFLSGRIHFIQGKVEEAANLFEAANQVRPEDYQSLLLAGQMHDDLGNKEKARDLRKKGVELAETHLSLIPDEIRALYLGANGLIMLDEKEKALEWLEMALSIDPDDSMLLYNAGCIYSLAHEPELSLNCLEKAVKHGLRQRGWFENDSNLEALRSLPRFQALVESLPC